MRELREDPGKPRKSANSKWLISLWIIITASSVLAVLARRDATVPFTVIGSLTILSGVLGLVVGRRNRLK